MEVTEEVEGRPAVWVGHVVLPVPDVKAAHGFFGQLGMRDLGMHGAVAILELRGGTHLVLTSGGAPVADEAAPFDLMVDDLETIRQRYESAGLEPTSISTSNFHQYFTLGLPSGHVLTINSSHVSGKPV